MMKQDVFPVRELEKYYSNSVHYDQCTIKGTCQKEGIRGRVLDMTVELLEGDQISFVCDGSVTVNIDKYDISIGEMA